MHVLRGILCTNSCTCIELLVVHVNECMQRCNLALWSVCPMFKVSRSLIEFQAMCYMLSILEQKYLKLIIVFNIISDLVTIFIPV